MRRIAVIALIFFLSGCASIPNVYRQLKQKSGELAYNHDSEMVDEKRQHSISVNNFDAAELLPPDAEVIRRSTSIYPFLVVNIWKQEFMARLGQSQLQNDYKEFMRQSLIEDLKRGSKFQYKEGNGEIAVDVFVKKVEISAPVREDGHFLFLFFFFVFGSGTTVGPLEVNVSADLKVSRDGVLLTASEVKGSHRVKIIGGGSIKLEEYTPLMIEGLSMAIKDLNKNIVRELNQINSADEKRASR